VASDVPAVMNAVRVLERIAREWPDPVSTGVLIEDLQLNRSTCYNILGTLQRAGWAATRGTGAAGAGAPAVGDRRRFEDWTSEVVQAELDELGKRLGFVTFALRRHGSAE